MRAIRRVGVPLVASLAAVVVLLVVTGLAVPAGAHLNHVTATPQVSPDGVVYVESALVVDTVWLVLHADDGGAAGRPIGHTLLDPTAGPTTDVPVTISPRAWENTTGPRTVWIDLYFDDGDGTFDASADDRLSRRGLFAPVPFTVAPGDARAYVGAQQPGSRPTTGTVVVRRVVLPGDGHLVIRNASGGSPGAIVGHAALPAGEHADVGVRLDESFYADRPSSFAVWAAVYVDDDGRLDDDDRPVAVGDTAVRSRFLVSKRASSPTPTPAEADLVTTPTDAGEPGSGIGVSGPGFGLVVAVVALVGFLLVVRYRSR